MSKYPIDMLEKWLDLYKSFDKALRANEKEYVRVHMQTVGGDRSLMLMALEPVIHKRNAIQEYYIRLVSRLFEDYGFRDALDEEIANSSEYIISLMEDA